MTLQVGPLVSLAEDLWEASALLTFPGGVRLPARMTIVRSRGKLLVHSPLPLPEELLGAVRGLGEVSALVAPNLYHHMFLGSAVEQFREARVYGVPGLPSKRKNIEFHGVLTGRSEELDAPFREVLEPVALAGTPILNEVAFYHRPSASLITADLVFNVQKPGNLATKLALTMMGTCGRLAQSRFFHFYTRDKAAMRASIEQLLAFPLRRVVMGHGDVFEHEDAGQVLRHALWMVRGR